MYFLNLTLAQFLAVFGPVAAVTVALYLLDRSRRRQLVPTLRFWIAAREPAAVRRRKRIQQPWSLILQLVSIALLLLAIAQLRWGSPAGAPRDHVLILDTSAWMAAKSGGKALMDAARERANAYIRAVPARDRIMLVRADALTTPATAFEPDRKKLQEAIDASAPGATALNLDQALAFARRLQAQPGRRSGEIAYVGAGRIGEADLMEPASAPDRNLRAVLVPDSARNCGLRKAGLRRSATDPELWQIYLAVRNYTAAPRQLSVALTFGPVKGGRAAVSVGARRLTLPAGSEQEVTFEYRTRAAGLLEASLMPPDDFPGDDHAVLELPAQPALPVTVYSQEPDLLRPVLDANPHIKAVYRNPAEYRPGAPGDLIILDRFRPPVRPAVDAIWIDPPADGSPIPVRSRLEDVPFAGWTPDCPIAAGLRTKDFRLASTSVFEAGPRDIKVGQAGEGAVIVAREEKPRTIVLGFHPALSAMRYELATPLLFANMLRWMDPEIFRRWEISAGSAGAVKMTLDADVNPASVRVLGESGGPVPFTLHDRTLRFFSGTPGTVRIIAGDREYVYSLTLPQVWDGRWEPPKEARRGLPRPAGTGESSLELWQWLALAGALGLLIEWFLFGRFGRGAVPVLSMRLRARRKAVAG
ncbi:MAG: VWA domain-containing protein [Bryobacteraceae bacterium]